MYSNICSDVNKKIKSVIAYYIGVAIYRLLIDLAYSKVIAPYYKYAGFENNFSAVYCIISWAILFLFASFSLRCYFNETKVSYEILFLLFLISFVPFTTMIAFGELETSFIICNSFYWLFLFGFQRLLTSSRKHNMIIIVDCTVSENLIKGIAIVSMIVVFAISLIYTRLRFNFSLTNVYSLRSEASSLHLPTIVTYLFSWSKTVNIVLLAYFIRKKKIIWCCAIVIIQLLSFGFDGSKSVVFMTALTIFFGILPKLNLKKLNTFMLYGLNVVILGCNAIFLLFNNLYPVSLIVRRVLILPVKITTYYFDFFTNNMPDYFRQSFLRHFGFQSLYDNLSPMIGLTYEGVQTNANNGLLSDAMANLGYVGIIVMPFLLAIVFLLLDKCSEGLDARIFITIALSITITLTNSFLFTALLTHGIIVAMIVLFLIKKTMMDNPNRIRIATTFKFSK